MNTNQRLVTLCPVSSLNAANVESFQRSLYEAIKSPNSQNILVNLGQVDLIDSAAVVALVRATKLAKVNGKSLGLCGLNSQVRMVLELTQMDRFVTIFAHSSDFVEDAAQLVAA